MKCYDCNNEATHFIEWNDGMFELCSECYDFAIAESVANNALPKLMGALNTSALNVTNPAPNIVWMR